MSVILNRFIRAFDLSLKGPLYRTLGYRTFAGRLYAPPATMNKAKRPFHGSSSLKKKKVKQALRSEGSYEEVLLADIKRLRATHGTLKNDSNNDVPEDQVLPERFSEIQLKIDALSSTGDGLSLSKSNDHVYVVPFAIPGDLVTAKVVTSFPSNAYTLTDFVDVVQPSERRDSSRIKCPYFAKCSGCQFQMLSYEDQLQHKRAIVERAYANFSNLNPDLIPEVATTIGSPLQYGYRTKLTPHFDGPPGSGGRRKKNKDGPRPMFTKVPPIGFMVKGRRITIDIEDCPIGTEAVRMGMKAERERVARELDTYKKGATLLLRETTKRIPKDLDSHETSKSDLTEPESLDLSASATATASVIRKDLPTYIEEKSCITSPKASATEYIDDYVFSNTAGAFFQNNNSILSIFTAYVRQHAHIPRSVDQKTEECQPTNYLIDAYCGSGLFTITLSSLFNSSTGIDIADLSILSARENALANKVANTHFIAADAAALFKDVTYPPEQTVMVIDPPRKGCDENFLGQLLTYGPRRVIYVSCNVHTQARDVGVLVEGSAKWRYDIETLQGFDFFPQTGHVESVAVLNRAEKNQQCP